MKNTDQRNQTIKIDECETSIFSDGSIIVDTADKELLCFDFHDIANLLLKADKIRDAVQSESSFDPKNHDY